VEGYELREDGTAEDRSAKTQSSAPKTQIEVALTIGPKRVIASVLDWPGWARIGRDEQSALDVLCAYGPRYQRAIRSTKLDLQVPTRSSQFAVAERQTGNATTDYGVPDIPLAVDAAAVDTAELRRLHAILSACWGAFEGAVATAAGKELRKGPRGGGRDVEKIVDHVIESHSGYLRRISWREPRDGANDLSSTIKSIMKIDARALAFAASDEMPAAGPRGGKLWTPSYFVRRAAWHILDHAWEIEDRLDG
jgi:hypothetical protein